MNERRLFVPELLREERDRRRYMTLTAQRDSSVPGLFHLVDLEKQTMVSQLNLPTQWRTTI